MILGEICNREVVVVERAASAADAARLMRGYHVGDLVVVEARNGERVPVGILTDRDLVVEVLAQDLDPQAVTVGDLMSYELTKAWEQDDVEQALELMRSRGIRRLPVVDEFGALIGIVTVDDLLEYVGEQLSDLVHVAGREQQRERTLRP